MIKVERPALSAKAKSYLTKQHGKVTAALLAGGNANIDRHWKTARQTKTVFHLLTLLQGAMGPTQRCMYCVDSHGSDIEHFWPKAPYPLKSFEWSNWLLCCAECGRIKGSQFPLTTAGQPALIDPTVENPWMFLDYDPGTGNVTSRYDAGLAAPNPRGLETVRVLSLDRREGLAEAYKRTFKRLAKLVQEAVNIGAVNSVKLIADLREKDDHGLLEWCFSTRGATCQPFKEFHGNYPAEWEVCAAALT